MNSILLTKGINYPQNTLKRAARALSCSPFKLNLFISMQAQSIPLQDMVETTGLQKNYTERAIAESTVESYLMWLIKVGILRREVDGQGITDSFRLTPLGRKIVAKWQSQGNFPQPSWQDKIFNGLNRRSQWFF